jgi:hypothetical protein
MLFFGVRYRVSGGGRLLNNLGGGQGHIGVKILIVVPFEL